eukprot:XP_003967050.2 PREDICTED: DEP domain-containing protein 7-like [Takifugu rubripes]
MRAAQCGLVGVSEPSTLSMASIKERAPALNLDEKLCVRPQAHGVSIKSVQSSCVWNGLILHLKSSVAVKPRRLHLKSYSDCFLGSEAVDVLEAYMKGVKGLEGARVPRPQVARVCQTLLDCHLFEAVGTKVFGRDRKQDPFQDSRGALYRFAKVCAPSLLELERSALVNGIQNLFCSTFPDRRKEQTCPTGAEAEATGPTRQVQAPVEAERSDGPSLGPLRDALTPVRVKTPSELPQSTVEEVWQEQTLLKLLTLVELPLLEGLLRCSRSPTATQGDPELTCSSSRLDRRVLEAFGESRKDEWLRAALDCLHFLPDQPVVELSMALSHCFLQDPNAPQSSLAAAGSRDAAARGCWRTASAGARDGEEQPGVDRWKLLLFETLVKHYGHTDRPALLPQHLTHVYTAITDLLANAKWATALEALQLCLKLLPPACRDELSRLLTFMSLAADPQEIKLNQELENRLVVKNSFSKAIINNKSLSNDKEDLMVVFMLSNIKDIFKVPRALHKDVSDKLASLAEGKPPDVMGTMFCYQVSGRTYADSSRDTTKQELWNLLKSIDVDGKISSKERKRLLGQFYRAHPEIFNQYFGESALGVL